MIRKGQRVLNHGSSSSIDAFAVQIAKAFGKEVAAVCSNRNVKLMVEGFNSSVTISSPSAHRIVPEV